LFTFPFVSELDGEDVTLLAAVFAVIAANFAAAATAFAAAARAEDRGHGLGDEDRDECDE
jgi:hypothetical protein